MATFNTKSFIEHDDYTTPLSALCNIKKFIPHGKDIWWPFYCDGEQKNDFEKLGFENVGSNWRLN